MGKGGCVMPGPPDQMCGPNIAPSNDKVVLCGEYLKVSTEE
jgi:hypothetical protein